MNGIKESINEIAERVISEMGWELGYGNNLTRHGLCYPYAISFGKLRQMMSVRLARHPDVKVVVKERTTVPKKDIQLFVPPEIIASRLFETLIPRVIEVTDDLVRRGVWQQVEPAEHCPYCGRDF